MNSNRKHWLSAVILSALLTAFAVAQNPDGNTPPPPPVGGPGMHGEHPRKGEMAKALGLTDEQKKQMEQLHQDQKARLDALRNDTSLTQDQKREQMRAIRQEAHTRMNSILTPEQQEKMRKFHAEHKGRMGGRREHRHGPPPEGGQGPGQGGDNN